jgi:hypothetical protein
VVTFSAQLSQRDFQDFFVSWHCYFNGSFCDTIGGILGAVVISHSEATSLRGIDSPLPKVNCLDETPLPL